MYGGTCVQSRKPYVLGNTIIFQIVNIFIRNPLVLGNINQMIPLYHLGCLIANALLFLLVPFNLCAAFIIRLTV